MAQVIIKAQQEQESPAKSNSGPQWTCFSIIFQFGLGGISLIGKSIAPKIRIPIKRQLWWRDGWR